MAVTRNLRDGTVRLVDGTGTPVTKEVTLLDGKLEWEVQQPTIVVKDRGTLDHFRKGDQEGVKGSCAFKYVEHFNGSTGGIYEFLLFLGVYVTNTSTTSGSDRKTLHVEFYVDDPGGGTDELVKFMHCAITNLRHQQGDEYDTISFDFVSLAALPTLSKTNHP